MQIHVPVSPELCIAAECTNASLITLHPVQSKIPFLITDGLPLNDGNGKVIRWKMELANYNFALKDIPGKRNVVADALSRLATIQANGGYFNPLRRGQRSKVLGTDVVSYGLCVV